MKRLVLILLLAFFAMPSVALAEDYLIHNEDGGVDLYESESAFEHGDTPIYEWTGTEWAAENADLEAEANEMGYYNADGTSGFVNQFGSPDNVGLGGGEAGCPTCEDATDLHSWAVEQGNDLDPEVAEGLDELGEAAGTLPEDVGASSLGEVALAAGQFTLAVGVGVVLGNTIDQLFGFPAFELKKEEERIHETSSHTCTVSHLTPGHGIPFRTVEEEVGVFFELTEPGYYISCGGRAETGRLGIYSKTYPVEESGYPDGFPGAQHTKQFKVYEKVSNPGSDSEIRGVIYETYSWFSNECEVNADTITTESSGFHPGCVPTGIPALGKKPTGEQSKIPQVSPPAKTEPQRPTVPEHTIVKVLEIKKVREVLEKHSPRQKEAEKEAEKELLLPPAQANETATQYNARIRAMGFTDTEVIRLTEAEENSQVGPDGVAGVEPEPGHEYAPKTEIKVEENPATVSPPETTGVGPPTEPGLKLPSFAVLCKGFPFGVPCWLAETISSWSATGKAPEWGLEEIEIDHTKIPSGKFNLAKLEPEMEIIRPAILIFATIGIVLLFFSFAKGGGPPSGGGAEGDSTPSPGPGTEQEFS